MNFILFSLGSGVLGFFISYFFRQYEEKVGKVFLGRQFWVQIGVFGVLIWVAWKYFQGYTMTLGSLKLNWIWAFIILETLASLFLQVVYENVSGKKLFNEPQK